MRATDVLHRIPELNLHARIDSAGSICFAAAKTNRRVIVLNKQRQICVINTSLRHRGQIHPKFHTTGQPVDKWANDVLHLTSSHML